MFKRILNLIIIFCFLLTALGPLPKAHADSVLGLPAPGTMVNLSPAYEPVIIKGLTVHKDNPFLFDFIVDVGQDKMSGEPLKKEGEKLIKYFLASLAIPDKDVWVNLSPYENSKIIPEALGQTDMGRDLLEQDYILKQITASLIYPEKQLGKAFWDKVYAKAQQQYGTTQVPVNTFNKVWIMADRAEVFEHNQTAFVVDQHLKVMLEEDYLALQKHQSQIGTPTRGHVPEGAVSPSRLPSNEALELKAPQGTSRLPSNSLASQIVKEIVLPELEKEVNAGKNFANLRQIFNSIILSSWYKKNLKTALLNQVYANKAKVKGIDLNDPTVKQQIYEQYLKAYKKGVFNYIREDVNAAGSAIPRKYFSGGFLIEGTPAANPAMTTDEVVLSNSLPDREMVDINTGVDTRDPVAAVTSKSKEAMTALDQLKDDLKNDVFSWDDVSFVQVWANDDDEQRNMRLWSNRQEANFPTSLDDLLRKLPKPDSIKIINLSFSNKVVDGASFKRYEPISKAMTPDAAMESKQTILGGLEFLVKQLGEILLKPRSPRSVEAVFLSPNDQKYDFQNRPWGEFTLQAKGKLKTWLNALHEASVKADITFSLDLLRQQAETPDADFIQALNRVPDVLKFFKGKKEESDDMLFSDMAVQFGKFAVVSVARRGSEVSRVVIEKAEGLANYQGKQVKLVVFQLQEMGLDAAMTTKEFLRELYGQLESQLIEQKGFNAYTPEEVRARLLKFPEEGEVKRIVKKYGDAYHHQELTFITMADGSLKIFYYEGGEANRPWSAGVTKITLSAENGVTESLDDGPQTLLLPNTERPVGILIDGHREPYIVIGKETENRLMRGKKYLPEHLFSEKEAIKEAAYGKGQSISKEVFSVVSDKEKGVIFDWLMGHGYFVESEGQEGHTKPLTSVLRAGLKDQYPSYYEKILGILEHGHEAIFFKMADVSTDSAMRGGLSLWEKVEVPRGEKLNFEIGGMGRNIDIKNNDGHAVVYTGFMGGDIKRVYEGQKFETEDKDLNVSVKNGKVYVQNISRAAVTYHDAAMESSEGVERKFPEIFDHLKDAMGVLFEVSDIYKSQLPDEKKRLVKESIETAIKGNYPEIARRHDMPGAKMGQMVNFIILRYLMLKMAETQNNLSRTYGKNFTRWVVDRCWFILQPRIDDIFKFILDGWQPQGDDVYPLMEITHRVSEPDSGASNTAKGAAIVVLSMLLPATALGKAMARNGDPAMTKQRASVANSVNGGIDLNTANGMDWKVSRDGPGVQMSVDPALIARIQREGINWLSPVIFKMTPVASIWPLVGLQAPVK
ncbi:MAG: hypothetical protein HQL12_03770 [Candidatus Omnitrophica bacterium]|nr:hypothetical protein [Candidatus Omnitrophota bacterium]